MGTFYFHPIFPPTFPIFYLFVLEFFWISGFFYSVAGRRNRNSGHFPSSTDL